MPSENKKNPGLTHFPESYEFFYIFSFLNIIFSIPYISPLNFLLEFRGLFSLKKATANRLNFDKIPIYLKHTLYHDDEHMKKARTLETSHRFFIYDKFKEQGNKSYNKGLYKDAIALYERALSCFKWLEVKEDEDDEEEENVLKKRIINGGSETEEEKEEEEEKETTEEKTINMEKAFPVMSEEERAEIKKEQKELKQKYKKFMTTYSDKNVVLKDGDEIKDPADIDMSNFKNKLLKFLFNLGKSLLLATYISLSGCYMQLAHFQLALRALEDAFEISEKNSQLLFKRAQVFISINIIIIC